MNDHALVEALRSRAPEAPAALYDAYADRLYGYCWFRLRDRDAARVALCEAFIVAEAHIGRLRDAGRFGPWLYALARLECDRLEAEGGTEPAPPVAGHDQDDVDQRITAWRAVQGMPPLSREILELRVRHQLAVPDLGAVLDLPSREAQRALDRAGADLQESLTAELLAREGAYGCPGRAWILRERRGELTASMRRRLVRHSRECATCGTSRQGTVSPVKVYGLLPEAVPPESLRALVLSCFEDPELAGYRQSVAARAEDFDGGFPVRRRPETVVPPAPDRVPATDDGARRTAVRAVALVTVTSACVVLMAGTLGWALHDGDRPARRQAVPTDPSPLSRRPVAVPERQAPRNWAADVVRASPTWPLGATGSAAPPTARPTPPEGRGFEPGVPGGPGVLTVWPHYLDLGGESRGEVELLAQDGPVDWRARARGPVRLSRQSGRLEAGRPVMLRLEVDRHPDSSGQDVIVFRPGWIRLVVTWRPEPHGGPQPTPTRPSPPAPEGPSETGLPPTRPEEDPSSALPSSTPPERTPSGPPSSTTPEPPPTSGPRPAPEPGRA